MTILDIIAMAGGLAMFLFGMSTMGDSLAKMAGGKLEKILEKLTSKRIFAVLLGAGVTAVIQSSSATTVMVVGFVNSGIMNLNQAVGIIIGANIGTTVTSWILSLIGLQGDSLLLSLLKPAALSSICAFIGILLYMNKKDKGKSRDTGMILLGFAVLMFGMQTMSNAVAPLADDPNFTHILTMFSNPILGVVAGAVLTAVIQSSSASVGILQALSATGALSNATAFPIIMGQNIGTCVTAVLSSVGASVNARRASMIHFLFNSIGTVIFMLGFYLINSFVHFPFVNEAATAAGIATIHSVFNITCCLILLPFASLLVKLATMIVKDNEPENEEKDVLDERFLEKPAFALELCVSEMFKMCSEAIDSCFLSCELYDQYDEEKFDKISKSERLVDKYEDRIGSYLLKLSSKELSLPDNHRLSTMLYTLNDFERISDHSLNIAQTMKQVHANNLDFSKEAHEELSVLVDAIKEITNRTLTIYVENKISEGNEVEPLEQAIDDLVRELKERHITRLKEGNCSVEIGMLYEDLLTDMERVADHCSNIAVTLVEVSQNLHDSHSYLNKIKKTENEEFLRLYNEAKERYKLS